MRRVGVRCDDDNRKQTDADNWLIPEQQKNIFHLIHSSLSHIVAVCIKRILNNPKSCRFPISAYESLSSNQSREILNIYRLYCYDFLFSGDAALHYWFSSFPVKTGTLHHRSKLITLCTHCWAVNCNWCAWNADGFEVLTNRQTCVWFWRCYNVCSEFQYSGRRFSDLKGVCS